MFNLLFLVLLGARFWDLGLKPVHHDESINGWFVERLWQTGFYQYDPTNYHGPLLFYLFQGAQALGGWGVEVFRFVTVAFSVATVLWLQKWARSRFALSGWWLVGLLLSPGFLFFTRSGLHESPFVFFTLMAATAWLDVWFLRRPENLKLFFYGVTGALLLKETFAFPLALGMILSLPLWWRSDLAQLWRKARVYLGFHVAVCVLLWATFYTGFGRNPMGLLDFFRAFLPWAKTGAGGQVHTKSFWYFWELIWKYEEATFYALILCLAGLLMRGWVRGVCLWALGILLLYSLVPYKTPWCLISMQIPIWLAAGLVMARSGFLFRRASQMLLMGLGVFSASGWVALNFEPYTQPHPYIYVQTEYPAKEFVMALRAQIASRPELREATVQWATAEAWPFPWWLGVFTRQSSRALDSGLEKDVDLLLIDQGREAVAEKNLKGSFWKTQFPVRDARVPATVYLRKEKFNCPWPSCQEWVTP